MNGPELGAELAAPLLGLPLMLVALLLLALRVALFSRATSNWSSLFGGVVAVATVWLFATVALDRAWDILWLPRDPLGDWLHLPNVTAALIGLLAGGWLELRLRTEELGPVLTGVLEGCTQRNLYEWVASIGFLAFAAAVAVMIAGRREWQAVVGAEVLWAGVLGSLAMGAGLLAAGASSLRGMGPTVRGILLLIAGACVCLVMVRVTGRVERDTRDAIERMRGATERLSAHYAEEPTDDARTGDWPPPEERAERARERARWIWMTSGVAGEYVDETGATVPFVPNEQDHAQQQAYVLMPVVLRDYADDVARFRALWPYVALAGIALGLLRPLRAAPRPVPEPEPDPKPGPMPGEAED
ncbi:MAG: hypothetical protein ACYTCU_11605 [Planctomycetota bacterium]